MFTVPAGETIVVWISDQANGNYLAVFPGTESAVLSGGSPDLQGTLQIPALPLDPTVTYPPGFEAVASITFEAAANPQNPNTPISFTVTETGQAPSGDTPSPPLVDSGTVSLTVTEAFGDFAGNPVAPASASVKAAVASAKVATPAPAPVTPAPTAAGAAAKVPTAQSPADRAKADAEAAKK